MMGQRKGFKVTDADRKTRVGIAVEKLEDLRKKTVEKFKLSLPESQIVFQTRDGMVIQTEEDFVNLKAQTLLIWTKKGERAETDAEILYRTIREVNFDFLTTGEKVQEFFTEQMKTKVYKLAEVLKQVEEDKSKLSSREEDPEWFKGIDSRSKTKEEYMFRRSQDRIRGYFYKTKDDLVKKRDLPQDILNDLLQKLQNRLKNVQFFGCYLDRRFWNVEDSKCFCDRLGTFHCQGRWDKECCLYANNRHSINPYKSREDRIVFQTWNLDHRIERTRTVIPTICEALNNVNSYSSIDVNTIFEHLFTVRNLKLVHIVCHDKGSHKDSNNKKIKYLTNPIVSRRLEIKSN